MGVREEMKFVGPRIGCISEEKEAGDKEILILHCIHHEQRKFKYWFECLKSSIGG